MQIMDVSSGDTKLSNFLLTTKFSNFSHSHSSWRLIGAEPLFPQHQGKLTSLPNLSIERIARYSVLP